MTETPVSGPLTQMRLGPRGCGRPFRRVGDLASPAWGLFPLGSPRAVALGHLGVFFGPTRPENFFRTDAIVGLVGGPNGASEAPDGSRDNFSRDFTFPAPPPPCFPIRPPGDRFGDLGVFSRFAPPTLSPLGPLAPRAPFRGLMRFFAFCVPRTRKIC